MRKKLGGLENTIDANSLNVQSPRRIKSSFDRTGLIYNLRIYKGRLDTMLRNKQLVSPRMRLQFR